jgi:hypothetical protein
MYPSREEVDSYLAKMRKRGERTLSLLGQNQEFITAMNTSVGREILSDLIREHEFLLDRIASLDATEEEKMQYKVVRKMLLVWSGKIAAFENRIKEIKKEGVK